MRKVRLGQTEALVSRLGSGTMWFRSMSQGEADAAVTHALDRGINYFDCARMYGDAEIKLGRALGQRRDEAFIATKTRALDAAGALSGIEESRTRLGVDCIDLLQLHYVNFQHEFDQATASGGALEGALQAQAQGRIDHIGITGHRPEKLAEWLGGGQFATVLFHLSPVQPHAATDLLPAARALDVGTMAMRPTGSGLTNQYRQFLRYVQSHNPDVIVSGLTTPAIIDANIDAISREPDPPETRRLQRLADAYGANFCRRCSYCECPIGIDIPEAMLAEHVWRAGKLSADGTQTWDEAVASIGGCQDHEPCTSAPICEPMCPYELPIRRTMMGISDALDPE